MYATLEHLKQYKQLKKAFSKMFNANESTVQKCSDEIIDLFKANNFTVTPAMLVAYANDNTKKLYVAFDWNATDEVRLQTASLILDNASLLISSDNKIYKLSKNE